MVKLKEGKNSNMVVLSIKVPPDLKAALKNLADAHKADERDMSFWARKFLKTGLAVYEKESGEAKGRKGATKGEVIGRAVESPARLKEVSKRG